MIKDLGLLIARGIVGLGIASHGAQKQFGLFGGSGLDGAAGLFEQLRFVPGKRHAQAASLAELGSGTLIFAGAFNPAGPAALYAIMLVAMETAHRGKGFFASQGGLELPLLYAGAGLALACAGPGKLSFDALFGIKLDCKEARIFWAYAIATGAAFAVLAQRQPAAPPSEPPASEPSSQAAS